MEYIVLESPSRNTKHMAEQVMEHIAQGWKPYGGVSCGEFALYQAMVKEE